MNNLLESVHNLLIEEILSDKWAVGKNAAYVQNHSIASNSNVTVVYVNPIDVIKNTPPSFRVSPNSSENHIGNRMQKALQHLQTPDSYMDPAFVALNFMADSKDFPLIVDDGRHRLAAAAKLGLKKVPVWVMKDQLANISKVIKTQKL